MEIGGGCEADKEIVVTCPREIRKGHDADKVETWMKFFRVLANLRRA